MSANKEKTPRTNKALKNTYGLFRVGAETNGFADHARQLETELNEAKERAEELEDALRFLMEGYAGLYDADEGQKIATNCYCQAERALARHSTPKQEAAK